MAVRLRLGTSLGIAGTSGVGSSLQDESPGNTRETVH